MEFTKIIIQSYQTEKTYAQQNGDTPKYAFLVDPRATKNDISIAFQSIYGKKPASVTTQIRKPTSVRTGTLHPGFSKKIKIAYIGLAKGDKITETAEVQEVAATKKDKKPASVDVSKKEVKVEKKTEQKPTAAKKEVKAAKKEVK
ncbi:MAG: hypothetical protein Ta2E_08580 [Mycoplasmoidaceae bacterium]|nr:MAG: hypothetical protein Ta2E_08580 [Mycoplasmoidaceae bacterium]